MLKSIQEGVNPVLYEDAAEYIGVGFRDKPNPIVYGSLYTVLMNMTENDDSFLCSTRVKDIVDRYDPYILFLSLINSPYPKARLIYKALVPKFPYENVVYDPNKFITQLGEHKISDGFNLALQDYIASIQDRDERVAIQNRIVEHFLLQSDNNTLEFIDLYNYVNAIQP
jgi:hypothetical protein